MKDCKHKRGDMIYGMWICADCFKPLDHRPVRYDMLSWPKGQLRGVDGKGLRQSIVWQAETAKDAHGVTFSQFVGWMVGYLRLRSLWTISKEEARQECLQVLIDQGEPFGSGDACWSKDDAKELVRDGILVYWDDCGAVGNS